MRNKPAATGFADLSRYRRFLMGAGILWIMLYHIPVRPGWTPLRWLQAAGYGGVDMLLLCSGMGCWYSLTRSPDAYGFLKRRVLRIAPTYLLFMLVWIPCMCALEHLPVRAALGNLLCVQQLAGSSYAFNWYISAMWILYLLSPYMVALCRRCGGRRDALALAFLLLLSVPFWKARSLLVIVSRFPVFYVGIVLGKHAQGDRPVSARAGGLLLGAMLLGTAALLCCQRLPGSYLWDYALYWYPFLLITPGLCLLLSQARRLLEGSALTPVLRGIDHLGDISLELYLLHALVFRMLRNLIARGVLPGGGMVWLLAFALSLAMSELFHRLMQKLEKRINPSASRA